MEKYHFIDKSNYPIINTTINPVVPTMKDMQDYLNEFEEVILNYDDTIFIIDLSRGKALSSEVRILHGQWLKEKNDLFKKKVKGIVLVNESLIMSFMMKGIMLIQKPPIPYTVVRTHEEAIFWINHNHLIAKAAKN